MVILFIIESIEFIIEYTVNTEIDHSVHIPCQINISVV